MSFQRFLEMGRKWIAAPDPPATFRLKVVTEDSRVFTLPGPYLKDRAFNVIEDYHTSGLVTHTETGFYWIPPSRIKRIEAERITPDV